MTTDNKAKAADTTYYNPRCTAFLPTPCDLHSSPNFLFRVYPQPLQSSLFPFASPGSCPSFTTQKGLELPKTDMLFNSDSDLDRIARKRMKYAI